MNQYRITVEGSRTPPLDIYPAERWAAIAEACEDRGLGARFERRLITDPEILDLVDDTTGYIRLGSQVLCPWETIALFKEPRR